MKIPKIGYILAWALCAPAVVYGITTMEATYSSLKKNPRYRKMSYLEIAIDRNDFEAIRYFEFKTTLEELKQTRVLLQNKIAGINEEINDQKQEFLTQPEKATWLGEVEKTRGLKADFEAILRETERRIEAQEKK